eukprot:87544-Chlamydomonas_euryale.AAC.3
MQYMRAYSELVHTRRPPHQCPRAWKVWFGLRCGSGASAIQRQIEWGCCAARPWSAPAHVPRPHVRPAALAACAAPATAGAGRKGFAPRRPAGPRPHIRCRSVFAVTAPSGDALRERPAGGTWDSWLPMARLWGGGW